MRPWTRLNAALTGNRRLALTTIGATVLSYALLYVLAAASLPLPFAIALTACYVTEIQASLRAPRLFRYLERLQLGPGVRAIVRDAAVVVLLARLGLYDSGTLTGTLIGVVLLCLLGGSIKVLLRYLRRLRSMAMPTRNIDVSALQIPDAPPFWLNERLAFSLGILLALGVMVDLIADATYAGPTGLMLAVILGIGLLVTAIVHIGRNWHLDSPEAKAAVLKQVAEYKPQVILYFSLGGAANSTDQVDMWLSTLRRLNQRTLILVRERAHVQRISPTDLPILCIPSGADVMDLDFPDLRIVLYVGNVGKNVHMLRIPGVRHVFIGHGDSDKAASANPVSRVYDQVWVAGRAGRDRYHRAGSRVRDEAIVEVGRPQLDVVEQVARRSSDDLRGNPFTVLYAPTWEGWTADMALSSLAPAGVVIIKTLLSLAPDIRIIYKPHPLTGYRDPSARLAHERISALLDRANCSATSLRPWSDVDQVEVATALAQLAQVETEVARLRAVVSQDLAQHARDHSTASACQIQEIRELEQKWTLEYWESRGRFSHHVVTGPRPDLYSCFNQADMMIADISAVVSDFIASGKPYALMNMQNQSEADFRTDNTVAGGAYILPANASGLAELVTRIRAHGDDDLREQRRLTREYILGPIDPPAMVRFQTAVDNLMRQHLVHDNHRIEPQPSRVGTN